MTFLCIINVKGYNKMHVTPNNKNPQSVQSGDCVLLVTGATFYEGKR